jgi:regulator of protease activity HflC (stomatin/prohibitin superfamily)
MADSSIPTSAAAPDAYRGVVRVLLALSILGMLLSAAGGLALGTPALLAAAVSLWLSTGLLAGVAITQEDRAIPPDTSAPAEPPEPSPEPLAPVPLALPLDLARTERGVLALGVAIVRELFSDRAPRRADPGARAPGVPPRTMQRVTALAGGVATVVLLLAARWSSPPPALLAGPAAVLCLAAAGLCVTAARYLLTADPERFPEAAGLGRGARVMAWVLGAAAAAVLLAWSGFVAAAISLGFLISTLNGVMCLELLTAAAPAGAAARRVPTDLLVFSVLGGRANPLASVLDAAQRQLGIDLRSTWALDVVRRSAEPLLVALVAIGWLSTALTVLRVEEQGLIERLGVPLGGIPLAPGLHVHWPWPIDRVIRIPVGRVQTSMVGHEGEEESGPEDVLWARQHGKAEYTLLLGNGRDLIAVDAAVRFRIVDPRSWRYRTQNPADALRAIAYRAVMKSTVGRTLAQALSENVVALTAEMRAMVQAEVDALGLGVEVIGFTVGGMHPPVLVAADYQAVVSAALAKTTAAIDAQAYHNEIVPTAEAEAFAKESAARADGATGLGRAAGEAWSFRALESEYGAAPDEFRFRRRLEALEKTLTGRYFTVLDARIQRDGGELWLMK